MNCYQCYIFEQVFASNDYGNCGNKHTSTYLGGGSMIEFSRGKEFPNEESYHCYGVRTYSYGQCSGSDCVKKVARTYKVMALRRIQLRIEGNEFYTIIRLNPSLIEIRL